MENTAALGVLNTAAATHAAVDPVRDATLVKWTLIAVAMALSELPFYGMNKRLRRIGLASTATALMVFVGPWFKPALSFIALPMLPGQLLLIFAAWRWATKFLDISF